jgi:hypothetical protein
MHRKKMEDFLRHVVPTANAVGLNLNTRDYNHIRTHEESVMSYRPSL